MGSTLGAGIWALVFGVTVSATAGAVAATRALAKRAGLSDGERHRAVAAAGGLVGGWLVLWTLGASLDFFRARDEGFPLIVVGIVVPLVTAAVLLRRSETLRRLVAVAPQPWLVGVHAARILGGVFIVLHLQGKLPAVFAYPAGIGDMLVAVAALPVAWSLAARKRWARRAAVAFNVAGLADFVVAVGTGFLSAPSPVRLFLTTPSTELMTVLPLVLVPVFLVPMWTIVHWFSLRELRSAAPAADERRMGGPLPNRSAAHGAGVS